MYNTGDYLLPGDQYLIYINYPLRYFFSMRTTT